jgi:hypothetical protein
MEQAVTENMDVLIPVELLKFRRAMQRTKTLC